MKPDFVYTEMTKSIQIEVLPRYVASRSNSEADYFFYSYTVTITNCGEGPYQLLRRHWIIRDGHGLEEHVRGEGVIGEQPVISPGETYRYTSACPLRTPTGNMRGAYEMLTPNSDVIDVNIPLFFLRPPQTFQ